MLGIRMFVILFLNIYCVTHMKQVEEIKHAHRLELANGKMEFLKARGEVEKERDKLQTQVEGRFLQLLPFALLAVPIISRLLIKNKIEENNFLKYFHSEETLPSSLRFRSAV